jgi:hypothetical protein
VTQKNYHLVAVHRLDIMNHSTQHFYMYHEQKYYILKNVLTGIFFRGSLTRFWGIFFLIFFISSTALNIYTRYIFLMPYGQPQLRWSKNSICVSTLVAGESTLLYCSPVLKIYYCAELLFILTEIRLLNSVILYGATYKSLRKDYNSPDQLRVETG